MNGTLKTYWLRIMVTVGVLALLISPTRAAGAHGITYTVTDLGTLGGPTSFANGINNVGQVVGVADTSTPDPSTTCAGLPANALPTFHGFLWQNGVMHDLPPFGADPDAVANGINDRGQVAGNSGPLCISLHAVVWQNSTPTDLGSLGGTGSFATGINNRAQAVGFSATSLTNNFHAFLGQKGAMSDLGTLGGGYSFAYSINDQGQVVGTANNTAPDLIFGGQLNHAFLWQQGAMSDLGTLGGPDSAANAVNNLSQVAGLAYTNAPDPSAPFSAPEFHPFIWQAGVMHDLRPFGNNPDAVALGMNDHGQVVGGSGDFFQPFQAVLWQNGTVTDLNALIPANSGWQLLQGNAINSQGQIVGYGMSPAGHFHGFLLTPTTSGGPLSAGTVASSYQTTVRTASLPAHLRALLHWGKPSLGGHAVP